MAIAALVCGICGILFGLIGGAVVGLSYLALVASLVAVVLGIRERGNAMQLGQPTGMSTAGFVCGIVGAVISLITGICTTCICIALCSNPYASYLF